MQLQFRDLVLGEISYLDSDGPDVWGRFTPNQNSEPFMIMWRFITNDDGDDADPPVPAEYLNDELWSIVDDDGTRRGVFLPAVHKDGLVGWRWRDF